MALERQTSKPEIAAQKKLIKLSPALGDWTTYKPPLVQVKKVRSGLYGFDRLSKGDLDLFLRIHYRFIQKLLSGLKIDLGMAVELFSLQAEQTTYLNFLRSLTGPMVQCKITGTPEPILMLLDLALASTMINYSLGSVDTETINRKLTEAETTVLSAALNEYLPELSSAFNNAVSNLTLSIVGSPDVVIDATINPSSTFVTFSADASLADNPPSRIYIGYSGNTLRQLLTQYRKAEETHPIDFSRLPSTILSKVKSKLAILLGETQLTTGELRSLEVGDVVSIDTSIDAPLPILIGNTLTLLGQPGNKMNKAAIKLVGLKETADVALPPPQISSPVTTTSPPPIPTPPSPKPMPISTPTPTTPAPQEEFEDDLLEEDFLDEEFPEDFPEDKFLEEEKK